MSREQEFLEVLAAFPGDPVTLFGLASFYRAQGRLDEAIARFRECLAAKPDYGAAYLALAEILIERDLLDDARAVYRDAIRDAERAGDQEIVQIATERLRSLA